MRAGVRISFASGLLEYCGFWGAVEIGRQGQFKDMMLIDYDELASPLNAIDYLSKLDVSVSSLNSFDAAYTTKGGFRPAQLIRPPGLAPSDFTSRAATQHQNEGLEFAGV